MTRRDKCHLVGLRMMGLTHDQSSIAWKILSHKVCLLGEADIPKYKDLIHALRVATTKACAK